MDEALEELFCENTRRSRDGCTIRCKQGLWAVSGSDPEKVLRDARHYFVQYLGDGEYGNH